MTRYRTLAELPTPALLIEQPVLTRNIGAMQQLADSHGVSLRSHIKSHKSIEIARLQLQAGAVGIAVAKLGEAEVMAGKGITDIQIANQVVGTENVRRLLALSSQAAVSCAIDSEANARQLSVVFADAGKKLPVLIEIDSGLHRCGLSGYEEIAALASIAGTLPGLTLAGIMTHAGHAYAAVPEEVAHIGAEEGTLMVRLAERLRADGLTIDTVSIGSTPTARHAAGIPGVTELRVGNYVFHDMMQVSLGVAALDQCALSVLTTVISTPSPHRAVVDAGSKALTTDIGAHGNQRLQGYGQIMGTDLTMTRLSEEHGVIEDDGSSFILGQRLRIVPNHACAVVNLFDVMYLCEGTQVMAELPVDARGRVG